METGQLVEVKIKNLEDSLRLGIVIKKNEYLDDETGKERYWIRHYNAAGQKFVIFLTLRED